MPSRACARTLCIREFGITKKCSANYRYTIVGETDIIYILSHLNGMMFYPEHAYIYRFNLVSSLYQTESFFIYTGL